MSGAGLDCEHPVGLLIELNKTRRVKAGFYYTWVG